MDEKLIDNLMFNNYTNIHRSFHSNYVLYKILLPQLIKKNDATPIPAISPITPKKPYKPFELPILNIIPSITPSISPPTSPTSPTSPNSPTSLTTSISQSSQSISTNPLLSSSTSLLTSPKSLSVNTTSSFELDNKNNTSILHITPPPESPQNDIIFPSTPVLHYILPDTPKKLKEKICKEILNEITNDIVEKKIIQTHIQETLNTIVKKIVSDYDTIRDDYFKKDEFLFVNNNDTDWIII